MSASRLRVPFDAELPMVVASESLLFAGKRYQRGAPFPWRELGLSLADIWAWWQLCEVDCVERAPAPAPAVKAPSQPGHPSTIQVQKHHAQQRHGRR